MQACRSSPLSLHSILTCCVLCCSWVLSAVTIPMRRSARRSFKSLLNKLTLDNYETIKDKIVSVGIVSVTTLKGLIDQVRSSTYKHLLPHSPAMLSAYIVCCAGRLAYELAPG